MDHPFILYKNIFETATLTATSEAESVDNVFDWRTYLRWQATSTADQYLTADYGSATAVDAVGIAGHNLGTVGAEIALQSSTTGAWAGEEIIQASASPSDDSPILLGFTSASVRYWRLKLSSLGAAPEIGVACVGARLDFPEYPDAPLDYMRESPMVTEAISKGGHLLGAVTMFRKYAFSITFTYVARSFVGGLFTTFWEDHGVKHKPFFVSINQDEFTDGRFCRFPGSFEFTQSLPDTGSVETLALQFEGVL
jgi:hypothetical protein